MSNSIKSKEAIEAIIQEVKLMTTGQVVAFFRSRKQLDFLESILDFFPHGDRLAIGCMLRKENFSRRVYIPTIPRQTYALKKTGRGGY